MSQFGFGPDILKYASQSNFPATGESNKLYVAKDTNTIFHYDTNEYLQLGGSNVATMIGASSSAAGTAGLVPAPAQYDNTKYLRGDGTWSNVDAYSLGGIYFDRYSYAGGPTTDYGYLLYQSNPLTSSNTSFMRIQATPTPTAGKIPTYDTGACLKSTTPTANDNSTKVATTAYVDSALANFSGGISGVKLISTSLTPDANGIVTIPAMTGATSSAAGSAGLVPAPATTDVDKFLAGDGTYKSGGLPMVILSYGTSTWNDFITAYTSGATIYCYAENNTTSGQYRIAQLAYVNDETNPTFAQFQYYRATGTKTTGNSCDQLIQYSLDSTRGWYTDIKYSGPKTITATNGVSVSFSSNDMTISGVTMTGATSNAAGTSGLVPAPATTDVNKFLAGDGTYKSGGLPMVILSYGTSTWNDFINAYNNNVIVYCRASSNSNPATGSQTRMAFMAYVNNATTPTNVEFQYYRSVNSHSATQMGDQVFVYKLDKTSGWSVTTREASIKEINVASGSKLGVSWSSNKVTLSNTMTANDMPMSSSDATTTKAAIDTLNSKLSTVDITVTPSNGFEAGHIYARKTGNVIVIEFIDVKVISSFTSGDSIATLPNTYAPYTKGAYIYNPSQEYASSAINGTFVLAQDGTIRMYGVSGTYHEGHIVSII